MTVRSWKTFIGVKTKNHKQQLGMRINKSYPLLAPSCESWAELIFEYIILLLYYINIMHEQIKNQIKDAMRAKEALRLEVLRGLQALFPNELIAKKSNEPLVK